MNEVHRVLAELGERQHGVFAGSQAQRRGISRAALRHQLQTHGERPIFKFDDLSVDLVRRIVKIGDEKLNLSPKEYELLRIMVQHAGKVLTHKFLLNALWSTPIDPQYLRVYVRQLRQKIEPNPTRPHYILTETGIGYRLRAPD